MSADEKKSCHVCCYAPMLCEPCLVRHCHELAELRRFAETGAPEPVATYTTASDAPDDTAAPYHYVEGREYEPHLVIEDWGLNFNAGCVVKYMSRYERKSNPLKDLRKARQYLDFEIARLEGEK